MIIMVVIAVTIMVAVVNWLIISPDRVNIQEILMIAGIVLVVGFALFLALRRVRDVSDQTPGEDEMSRKIMRRGAATSYYVSIYLWLVIMIFEEKIAMDRSSLIGAGILGMAIIWVLSWLCHRFLSRKYD